MPTTITTSRATAADSKRETALKKYRYVIVRAGSLRGGYHCRNAATGEPENLESLFKAGWRPVRETPMGVAATGGETLVSAYCLVLLERETAGRSA